MKDFSAEFDKIAEQFYKDFGYYPIGKLNPIGASVPDVDTRAKTFGIWIKGYSRGVYDQRP